MAITFSHDISLLFSKHTQDIISIMFEIVIYKKKQFTTYFSGSIDEMRTKKAKLHILSQQ